MRLARILALGVVLACGYGLVAGAADEKDIKAAILKLAAAVEKNDKDAAKKLVDELKKPDLEEVMNMMKPPAKMGLDVGFKEGIELKLNAASKKAGDVKEKAAAYEKAATIVAAIAEVATVKCPVTKPEGEKDPKKWAEWIGELKAGAKELGEAAKKKDPKKVTAAAKKITGACNSCHGVFRD